MRQDAQAFVGRAPSRRGQFGERRADCLRFGRQQSRQKEREGAEPHAERLQHPPFVLAERPDVLVRPPAVEDAELLDQPIGEPARQAANVPVRDRLC